MAYQKNPSDCDFVNMAEKYFEESEIAIVELYYIYGSIPGMKNPAFDRELWKRFLDSEYNIGSMRWISEVISREKLLIDKLTDQEKLQYRIECIGKDIKKRGMINPLGVMRMKDDIFLVPYGNERLCWYKSQSYLGSLRCYVTDEWGFDKRKLNYKSVNVEGIGEC